MYICDMKIYVGIIDHMVSNTAFTSLKGICHYLGLPYQSALRGKRIWVEKQNDGSHSTEIVELNLNKIENRGRK